MKSKIPGIISAAFIILNLAGNPRAASPQKISSREKYKSAMNHFRAGRYEAAESDFQEAAGAGYKLPETFFYLGRIQFEKKNFREATGFFDEALSYETKSSGLYAIKKYSGLSYLFLKEYSRAISIFDELLLIKKNDPAVLSAQARLLYEIGMRHEALEFAERALKKSKKDINSAILTARINEDFGKTEKALQLYNDILRRTPDAPDEVFVRLYSLKIRQAADEEQHRALLSEILGFLKNKPHETVERLGLRYMWNGRYEEAYGVFQLVKESEKDRILILSGINRIMAGDYKPAMKYLSRVKGGDYQDAAYYFTAFIKYKTEKKQFSAEGKIPVRDETIKKYLLLLK